MDTGKYQAHRAPIHHPEQLISILLTIARRRRPDPTTAGRRSHRTPPPTVSMNCQMAAVEMMFPHLNGSPPAALGSSRRQLRIQLRQGKNNMILISGCVTKLLILIDLYQHSIAYISSQSVAIPYYSCTLLITRALYCLSSL